MLKKQAISACLVVHNEEKLIERCLKSIKSIVDEIIIVHDGPCSDKTLQIARKYTKKIYQRPFIGEAEPHRVFAYAKAKGEWILKIDADEFLSEKTQKAIPSLIKNAKFDGYAFLWPLWDGSKYRTKNGPYKLCLMRGSKLAFLGIPHYEEEIQGKVKRVPLMLDHQPLYNNLGGSSLKKWYRWSKIQAMYTVKDLKDIPSYNHPQFKRSTLLKKRFPLLLVVPIFFIAFVKSYISDSFFRSGFFGVQWSLTNAWYQSLVCFHIWRLKIIKKGKY